MTVGPSPGLLTIGKADWIMTPVIDIVHCMLGLIVNRYCLRILENEGLSIDNTPCLVVFNLTWRPKATHNFGNIAIVLLAVYPQLFFINLDVKSCNMVNWFVGKININFITWNKLWPPTSSLFDECLSVNALLLHCNHALSHRESSAHCDNLSTLVDWIYHPAN